MPDYFQVPLGLFLSAEKKSDKQNPSVSYIDIYTKDGRAFKIKFQMREVDRIIHVLQTYSTIERKEEYFAYEFFKYERALEEKYGGWKLYDAFKEFKRQGIDAEPPKENSTSTEPVTVKIFEINTSKPIKSRLDSSTWITEEERSARPTHLTSSFLQKSKITS